MISPFTQSLFILPLNLSALIPVFKKEFTTFLNSLIAYVVIAVFLTAIGLLMWVFPDTSVLDYGYADLETLFSLGPFILIFLVPAITMKSFAEERKMGTLELLFTKPLTEWNIVLGKFLACFLLVIVALAPTVIYYFSVYQLGNPPGNMDAAGVTGSYLGLVLLGGTFCAVGILASALTPNQIIAFMTAAFLCFLIYTGFDSISALPVWGSQALLIKQLGILYHYDSLSKGLIDSRDLVYFFSVAGVLLLISKIVISRHN